MKVDMVDPLELCSRLALITFRRRVGATALAAGFACGWLRSGLLAVDLVKRWFSLGEERVMSPILCRKVAEAEETGSKDGSRCSCEPGTNVLADGLRGRPWRDPERGRGTWRRFLHLGWM